MLKVMAAVGVVLALSGCGKLAEIKYRTDHLRFEKAEFEKSPGVLMRSSIGAWGNYDESTKLTAIIDYYTDPAQRLNPESLRFKWGAAMDEILDGLSYGLSGPKIKVPVPRPRELSREEAQRHVKCLNEIYEIIYDEASTKYKSFRSSRYQLFKVDAQCNAFLLQNPIPIECIGWDTWIGVRHNMRGKVVDKCAK